MLRGEPFPTFKTLVSELSSTALLVDLMQHKNFNALLDYVPGGWNYWEMSRHTRNNHDTLADESSVSPDTQFSLLWCPVTLQGVSNLVI